MFLIKRQRGRVINFSGITYLIYPLPELFISPSVFFLFINLIDNGMKNDAYHFSQKWQHLRREMANLSMWFLPWERKIKEIESHFGSVVASYFIFLRWLFWVNIVIAVVLISFVAIPEVGQSDFCTVHIILMVPFIPFN